MTAYVLFALVAALCALSVRERATQLARASSLRAARGVSVTPGVGGLPFQPRPSFISEALAGLLGTAGGIYLTLVMGAAFIGLGSPARIAVGGAYLDPLALASLAVAIVQPFLARLRRRWGVTKAGDQPPAQGHCVNARVGPRS